MDALAQKAKLLGSFLLFTQVFYKLRTGRDFVISKPVGRESHQIVIARLLTAIFRADFKNNNELLRVIMNLPPRYGKTELVIHFVAWSLAHYPDSNFIYVSYSHSLARKQTKTIRNILQLKEYKQLFDVHLKDDANEQGNFETTAGGSVYAVGAEGTITGRGAGIQNCDRFAGCIIIDDIHKPIEVTSDVMREKIKSWYLSTLQSRINSQYTPIIFIGQRLHEDDLAANLMRGYDGHTWHLLSVKALDEAKNALNPAMHTKEQLLSMQESMPYDFSSQYQQDPQPAGGGIYKREWFLTKEEEPEIISTFITADTAETSKTYNDATVFSFWGLYRIKQFNNVTDMYALHWLDCLETWIEPKDLKQAFLDFMTDCMRYPIKPCIAAIEKKSTGVTLLSTLSEIQGIRIINIERNVASKSKTQRFLEMQPYVAKHLITFTEGAKHVKTCIDHMTKITANDTHRRDDICDTAYDAVKLALIDKMITMITQRNDNSKNIASQLNEVFNKKIIERGRASWR